MSLTDTVFLTVLTPMALTLTIYYIGGMLMQYGYSRDINTASTALKKFCQELKIKKYDGLYQIPVDKYTEFDLLEHALALPIIKKFGSTAACVGNVQFYHPLKPSESQAHAIVESACDYYNLNLEP